MTSDSYLSLVHMIEALHCRLRPPFKRLVIAIPLIDITPKRIPGNKVRDAKRK